MDSPPKEVFVVHSKSEQRDAALAEALTSRLTNTGVQVWGYEDWEWQHRVHRRGRGAWRPSGSLGELDYSRYLQRHPLPFRGRVDEINQALLAELLHSSRVVLLCEPRGGVPSEGVFTERKVLANLSSGPILMHLLWPDSAGDFFAPLAPTFEIRLVEGDVCTTVQDEVFAAVVCGWLIHTVQRKYGLTGGHRLLATAGESSPALRQLIEASPQHSAPDSAGPRSSESPRTAAIRGYFERSWRRQELEFHDWWKHSIAALRMQANHLPCTYYAGLLRDLLSA
jgi:hypothetical protein